MYRLEVRLNIGREYQVFITVSYFCSISLTNFVFEQHSSSLINNSSIGSLSIQGYSYPLFKELASRCFFRLSRIRIGISATRRNFLVEYFFKIGSQTFLSLASLISRQISWAQSRTSYSVRAVSLCISSFQQVLYLSIFIAK